MKDQTDIIVILDRSGSMGSIKKDMEGGFAQFLKEQQETPGEATMSLYQFDDKYEVVYENKPIQEAPALILTPRDCTALLDALGKTVASRGEYYASLEEDQRPNNVIVVVITDGQENASTEFKPEQIKQMVETQQNVYKWQFIFLGANIDSFETAGRLGFAKGSTMDYAPSAAGVGRTYKSVSLGISRSRISGQSVAFTDEDRAGAMGGK